MYSNEEFFIRLSSNAYEFDKREIIMFSFKEKCCYLRKKIKEVNGTFIA